MAFSVEFMAVGVVVFFSGYFVGWWVRGRWEAKLKSMFMKTGKDLKKAKKKEKEKK